MPAEHWNVVLIGIFFLLITNTANSLTPPNVHCGPYIGYVVTDDHYKYYPRVVELHRCAGSDNAHINYGCRPTEYKYVKINVYEQNYEHGISLKNITSCEEVCLLNETSCNQYQKFDNSECQCQCTQDKPPTTCQPPFHWNQALCDCICSREASTHTCDKKMAFDKDFCKCMCKDKFVRRCRKQGKVIDPDTCSCFESPTTGKAVKECSGGGISGPVVVVIVVAEFILILVAYFLFKKFCEKPENLYQKCFPVKAVDETSNKKKEETPMIENHEKHDRV